VNTLNKIIITTALNGLLLTVGVFSFGLGIFAQVFPAEMAKFYDKVGDTHLAAMYYGKIYNSHKNPDNLFYAFTKSIDAKETKNIIKYGDLWFADNYYVRDAVVTRKDEYLIEDAAQSYEKGKLNQDAYKLVIATSCNTDDRLRCKYVGALLKCGTEISKQKAIALFESTINGEIKLNRPSFLYFEIKDILSGEQKTMFGNYFENYKAAYTAASNLSVQDKIKPDFYISFVERNFIND
jgi:hypothetical protein